MAQDLSLNWVDDCPDGSGLDVQKGTRRTGRKVFVIHLLSIQQSMILKKPALSFRSVLHSRASKNPSTLRMNGEH